MWKIIPLKLATMQLTKAARIAKCGVAANIGEVSEMFDLPVSTLRYYDKEGLFPDMMRVSGVRKFSDRELETLRVIECLKKSGMEIKDIHQFIEWLSLIHI